MGALRKEEANLSPHIQGLLQTSMKKASSQSTKEMHTAVHRLGEARKALQRTKASRLQMHMSWREYLTSSVDRWNKWIKEFETEDARLCQEQESALESLKHAKQYLTEKQEEIACADSHLLVDSEDDTLGPEDATKSLKEGLIGMAQSLAAVQEKAEESISKLEEQGRQKRPRNEASESERGQPDAPMGEQGKQVERQDGAPSSLPGASPTVKVAPFQGGVRS